MTEISKHWEYLPKAIELLAKGAVGQFPFHCEHDILTVMSDPAKFSAAELEQLSVWGFEPGSGDQEGTFYSFRFGSA